jgi:outer membrane immunogenic protein
MKGLWLGCVVIVIPIVQSVSADAADFSQPPPPLAPSVPYFNWTGFYIGGNAGGGWGGGNITDTLTGTTLSTIGEGAFVGGGQIGYNYQIGNVVLGAEWLMDGVAGSGSSNIVFIPAIGDYFQTTVKSDWFTTVTGRIGITGQEWNNVLLYIKGGAAWLQNQATVTDLSNGLSVGETKIDTGWVAGAGIEYAFAPNWTIRVEYDYMGFGNSTVGSMTVDPYNNNNNNCCKQKPTPPTPPVIPPVTPPTPTFVSETFNAGNVSNQVVTLGINYKFGAPPPPLVTKY